jgi:hypothetical protein
LLREINDFIFVIYNLIRITQMDPFFMYVSIGALLLLIIVLIIVGVGMSALHKQDTFPPVRNACPDYWDVSSNPVYCGVPTSGLMRNKGLITLKNSEVDKEKKENIGLCTAGSRNFGCVGDNKETRLDLKPKDASKHFQYMKLNNNTEWGTLYPGKSEKCAQKMWAETMGISWDGVTNYNGC